MWLNDLLEPVRRILDAVWHVILQYAWDHFWTVGAALYGIAWSFGVMIQSGQRGVLFRWGRAVKELEPGFHWLVPLMHGVKKTPVRSVTLDFANQKVMTADGLLYDVSANLVYRVEDATKALTLVNHVDQGCRAAIPIIVADVVRVRDQAQLVDRLSLDRELSEHTQAWVARWGLVVEQAGFKTIAPNKNVLRTTQLRSKATERNQALHVLMEGGLDLASALVMIGCERRPVAKSSRRYHIRTRGPAPTSGARSRRRKAAAPPVGASTRKAASPANPIKLSRDGAAYQA